MESRPAGLDLYLPTCVARETSIDDHGGYVANDMIPGSNHRPHTVFLFFSFLSGGGGSGSGSELC